MKLKCLIIDDEPIARKVIEEYISDISFLELCGKASNPVSAEALLNEQDIDLIFLDIQMPKMNGINFLKISKDLPMVIITTAFPEHALESYELDVIDYLVKPVPFDRFMKACNKAKEFKELRSERSKSISEDYFFIRCENKFEKVQYDDLLFVEAASNYVYLQTKDRKLITYLTFKGVEENLPQDRFIKVHKSYIVSLQQIDSIDAEGLQIGKFLIPISRNMKDAVMERVVNRRLLKR